MSWQVLRKHARHYERPGQPVLSVYPNSTAQLNRHALDLLGSPEMVVVYVDLETRQFAIARAGLGMPHARKLNVSGRSPRGVALSVNTLLRFFHLEVPETRCFPLTFQAGWLVGSVQEEETA